MKTKRGEHKKNILKLMTTIIEYFWENSDVIRFEMTKKKV
jgi:hypothetical protein